MLKIENINVYYGPIHALKDVSLSVSEGSIVSLIECQWCRKDHNAEDYFRSPSSQIGDHPF